MREHTEQLRQQVMDKAARAVDQVRQNAEAAVSDQKKRAAESVTCIADVLREAGKKLHTEQTEYVAPYADQAAQSLERFAGYLRDRDLWALVDDARGLAHRRPEWFIGGAFVLGLVAARFLKSSASGSPNVPARMQDVRSDRFAAGGDGSGRGQGAAGTPSASPGIPPTSAAMTGGRSGAGGGGMGPSPGAGRGTDTPRATTATGSAAAGANPAAGSACDTSPGAPGSGGGNSASAV